MATSCKVPEHELAAVRNLTGYDQMLEIDRLCKTYGLDETMLRAMMASASGGAGATAPQPTAQTWDTSHKEAPSLEQARPPAAPTLVDKQQFRFEYDPSREAAARREQVSQAILCSALRCGFGHSRRSPHQDNLPCLPLETTYTN